MEHIVGALSAAIRVAVFHSLFVWFFISEDIGLRTMSWISLFLILVNVTMVLADCSVAPFTTASRARACWRVGRRSARHYSQSWHCLVMGLRDSFGVSLYRSASSQCSTVPSGAVTRCVVQVWRPSVS